MVRRIVGSICAFTLLTLPIVTSEGAQDALTGTVKQVDPRTGVILLEDGRQIRTTGHTVVLVERPAGRLAALAPGTRVVIIEPEPGASPRGVPEAPSVSPFGPNSRQAP